MKRPLASLAADNGYGHDKVKVLSGNSEQAPRARGM
jgi:hypothetical protein